MSRRSTPYMLGSLLAAAFLLASAASATEVMEARWEGEDLLVRFADSVAYTVDLAASDSSELVIRTAQAELPRNSASGGVTLPGPMNREAILTASGQGELRITVRAGNRLGYASIWRPYSHTLVIHTFDWNKLEYGQEQYYKALLALEQGLEPQGLELLRIAYATGDTRAASALGIHHARRGDHALAAQYLSKPLTADDHAALAAGQLRGGDTASAAQNQQMADQMRNQRDSAWQKSNAMTRRDAEATTTGGDTWDMLDPRNRWLYLGGGILALILVIALVIWLARRSSRRQIAAHAPRPVEPPYMAPRHEPVERTATVRDIPPAQPRTDEWRQPVAERRSEPVREPVTEARVAEPPARAAEPAPEPVVERVPEPVAEPIAAAPVRELTPVEPMRTSSEPSPIAKEKAIDVEARPVAQQRGTEGLSTQAAELRRRIEEMRQQPPPPPAPPIRTVSATESTVDEARRLQLSRDSVELRRRLQQEAEKR